MKRILCLLFLPIIVLLSGCSINKKNAKPGISPAKTPTPACPSGERTGYSAKLFDCSDAALVNNYIEYTLGDTEKYDAYKPRQQVSVSINNNILTGEYKEHVYKYKRYNTFPEYSYDVDGYRFSVSPDGQLISYKNDRINPSVGGTIVDQKQSVNIAKNFLLNNVGVDVNLYKVVVTDDPENQYRSIQFTKYVGDFKTTDGAVVDVTYTGVVFRYVGTMLGKVNFDKQDLDFDMDSVQIAVQDKINQVMETTKSSLGYDRFERGNTEFLLTCLKDGRMGLLCFADVYALTDSDSGVLSIGQQFSIVIQ